MKPLRIDEIMSKVKNKFLLVNATILRAKQILAGSLPYVDDFDPTDSIITALKEISADKIKIKIGKEIIKPQALMEEEVRKKPSLAKEEKKKTKAPRAKKKK
ncbi:MAG: DNA-directed RNA polymerase subunit omega [bacterium]